MAKSKSISTYPKLRFGIIAMAAGEMHNMLLLDFDHKRCPRILPFYAVARIVGLHITNLCLEPTRKGWHVTIYLQEQLDPAVRVALQSIMGSDNRREALNIMRVIGMINNPPNAFWRKRWNLFFSRKLQ